MFSYVMSAAHEESPTLVENQFPTRVSLNAVRIQRRYQIRSSSFLAFISHHISADIHSQHLSLLFTPAPTLIAPLHESRLLQMLADSLRGQLVLLRHRYLQATCYRRQRD